MIGDGNCLFRVISHYIKDNEFMYNSIRTQIYNEAINRIKVIPNIAIESERGNSPIHAYKYYKRKWQFMEDILESL